MPSGKQSRRTRQAPVPRPPTAQGRRRASPKVLLGAAAVVVAVVVAIVLAIVLSGGGSSSNGPATALPDAGSVLALFRGIPQHGNVLGKSTAPVTMVEYVDPQCPYCDEFETQVFPDLVTKYVRPGKVKVEIRPLAFIGSDSVRGRDALIAAGIQNKFFQFMELLYDNQGTENTGWLNDAMVRDDAVSIPGLDETKLLSDMKSSAVSKQASAFDAQATANHVNQTPTVLVGKTGSTLKNVNLSSPTDEAAVVAAIKKNL